MYSIEKNNDSLFVTFEDDFNYSTIKHILYDVLSMSGFSGLDVVWLVGNQRAHIRLGELQAIVEDFSRLCPMDTHDIKMAIVAEPGLPSAILELLADGLDRKLSFSCHTFTTRERAEEWIGIKESCVA